jgi:hypothetical protein
MHRSRSAKLAAWACRTAFSKSCMLIVVVVGAAVVGGTVGAGSVVAAADVVDAEVVAIASETGGAAGAAFVALPPQEARNTSERAPAKVLNFDMRRR